MTNILAEFLVALKLYCLKNITVNQGASMHKAGKV